MTFARKALVAALAAFLFTALSVDAEDLIHVHGDMYVDPIDEQLLQDMADGLLQEISRSVMTGPVVLNVLFLYSESTCAPQGRDFAYAKNAVDAGIEFLNETLENSNAVTRAQSVGVVPMPNSIVDAGTAILVLNQLRTYTTTPEGQEFRSRHVAHTTIALACNVSGNSVAAYRNPDIPVLATQGGGVTVVNMSRSFLTVVDDVVHEILHTWGLRHNIEENPQASLGLMASKAHGYCNNEFADIMSYSNESTCSPDAERIQHISNPDVTWNGHPTGVVGVSEGSFVVDEFAPQIAGEFVQACDAGSDAFFLRDGKYRVDVCTTANGQALTGRAYPGHNPLSASTNVVVFDDLNSELLVKVPEACGVNGADWVFLGGATDLPFVVSVTNVYTDQKLTYSTEPGPFVAVRDTVGFPCE